jgi:hypothetical protein
MARLAPLYCSPRCERTEVVRSVTECSHCRRRWNGSADDDAYCNGAWLLCLQCAKEQTRCVVCGSPPAR